MFSSFLDIEQKFLAFKKFFWQGCQKFISLVLGNILEKLIFLERKTIFVSFPVWQKFSDRVVKTAFCVFKETNRGKVIFFQKSCFLVFFWYSAKTSAYCPWVIGKVVSTAFYVSKGTFPWKKSVCWPNNFSNFFSHFLQKISPFCLELCSDVLKNAFHMSMVTFWRTLVFLKKIYTFSDLFRTLGEKVLTLTETFRQACENCVLRVDKNFSVKKICLLTNLFLNLLSDIEQKNLNHLSEAFQGGQHDCILRFHQTNLSKYNSF